MPERQPDRNPLTLYIQYRFLPIGQLGEVLSGIETCYALAARRLAVAADASPSEFADFYVWPRHGYQERKAIFAAPLILMTAHTGQSVTFKFDVEKKILPHFVFKKGDLEILVPRWTAAAILVGAGLTWGMDNYNKFLEIQKNRLDIEKTRIELQQLERQRHRPEDHILASEAEDVRRRLTAPNIRKAAVNGVPVTPPARNE